MPRPWRIRYCGAKYHVDSRGNGRQRIFFGNEDYERFLAQLFDALEKDQVVLYAYCLMPNHYHLFVETPCGNIHRFQQRLNTAYGMYFRYKHSRPGHCFQGRYDAKLVDGEDYIVRLTRYIHVNPVETERMRRESLEARKTYLHEYRWSSFPGYVRQKQASEWVDYRWLGLMRCATTAGNSRRYRSYVEGMIGKSDDVFEKALDASRYAIGDERFIEQAEAELKEMRMNRGVFGDIQFPDPDGLAIEEIERAVSEMFGIPINALHRHGRSVGPAKGVAIELCCMLSGKHQRAIARHFGFKTDAGVTRQRRVLRECAAKDKGLRRRIQELQRSLSKQQNKK